MTNFTFFSSAHRTFSRIDYILDHESRLGKFKKNKKERKKEIISSIISNHNVIRWHVHYREKNIINTNIWRLNNMLLSNQQITE